MTNAETIDESKEHWLNLLRDARSQMAHYKTIEKEAKGELADGFTSETGLLNDRPVFQLITQRVRRFDLERFRAENPDLAEQYTREVEVSSLYLVGDQ